MKNVSHLGMSKREMMSQYNKNLRFHNHVPGTKVWLKTKYVKSGENKLAPKRTGPWTVIEKMPNGVNFRIQCEKSRETKVVHHDHLKPVQERQNTLKECPQSKQTKPIVEQERDDDALNESDSTSSASSREHSDYSPSESSSDDSQVDENENRRYPTRERRQRVIPGAIPWDSVQL